MRSISCNTRISTITHATICVKIPNLIQELQYSVGEIRTREGHYETTGGGVQCSSTREY